MNRVIDECMLLFNLEENRRLSEIEDFVSKYTKPTKSLAFLISLYKREETVTNLKKISDQPAALVRDLKNKGFIFKNNVRIKNRFDYKNDDGILCRKIIQYKKRKRITPTVKSFIGKSKAALLSAIEIYNKPDFKYREEIFSILCINSWELLLKAKYLIDHNCDISSLYVKNKKDGTFKENRNESYITIGLSVLIKELSSNNVLPMNCIANIEALIGIRDSVVHFVNLDKRLKKKIQEFGMASLKNYKILLEKWFDEDMSKYDFFLMPMSFFHEHEMVSFSINKEEKSFYRLVEFLEEKERTNSTLSDSTSITLNVESKIVKSTSKDVYELKYSKESDVMIHEEYELKFSKRYKMDYSELIDKISIRYSNFKRNRDFHSIMKTLEKEEKYCGIWYLDFKKKSGSKRKYYSTEIFKALDAKYKK